MSEELGVVKILRYNPAVDKEPHYEVFEDVAYQGRTVMGVLRELFEGRDSTLSFRCSCRAGLCTVCRMRLNGTAVMACMKLAEKEMLLEPLKGQSVIRDLMTTMDRTTGRDEGAI